MSSGDVEIHLKAFDEASSVIQKVGENTATALDRVETSGGALTKQTQKIDVSVRDTALSFNNMATAGMALYMTVDRVQEANIRLDRANLMVQRSNEALERAQTAYNLALSRFGVDSAEAKDAADKLALAQEAHRVALERAGQAQNSVSQTMMQAALTVIPSMITMVKSASDAFKGLEGASGLLGKAFDMLTGPVGMALMGVGALVGGIYMAWQNFTAAAAEAEKFRKEHEEICRTLEKTDSLLVATVTSTDDLARKYEGLTSACSALKKELETQEEHLTQISQNTENLNKLYGLLGTSIEQQGNMFAKNKNAVEDHITALQSEIDTAQKATEQTKRQLDISQLYFNVVTKASDEYKRSVADTGYVVTSVFENQTRSLVEKTEIVNAVVTMFAAKWRLSWDDAAKIVGDSAGKIIADMNKVQDKLAQVPEAVSESLVDRAQRQFQEFTNCVSGKMYTLQTDVSGQMATVAKNIQSLIDEGLIGEAQRQMQAYTTCSSGKIFDMASGITKTMEKLTKDHNDKIAEMKAYALTLTGQEQAGVLGQIDVLNREYQAKMANLSGWQEQLFKKMAETAKIKVDSISEDVEGLARGMEAKLRRLNEKLVGGSVWTDLMQRMVDQAQATTRVVGGLFGAMGAYATEAFPGVISFAGLALPSRTGPSTVITITGPLVHVAGSADTQTAMLAANLVSSQLKNVVVEASSPGAPETQKRLRFGGAGEIAPAAAPSATGIATGSVAPGASSPMFGIAESVVT